MDKRLEQSKQVLAISCIDEEIGPINILPDPSAYKGFVRILQTMRDGI